MSAAQAESSAAVTSAAPRTRAALLYAVEGDARFLAHHDEIRALLRALRRACWPLAYARGFNPRPRLTIPLPRSLGAATDTQLAIVDVHATSVSAQQEEALREQLPRGFRLERIIAPAPRRTPHPAGVTYEVSLDAGDVAAAQAGADALLSRDSLLVQREFGPERPTRPVDIRPHVRELKVNDGCLHFTVDVIDQRMARPSEVIVAAGLDPLRYVHHIRRVRVAWDIALAETPPRRPAANEEQDIGNQEKSSQQEIKP